MKEKLAMPGGVTRRLGPASLLGALAAVLAACSAVPSSSEAGTAPPLVATPVEVHPVGDPSIQLVKQSHPANGQTDAPPVTFALDDAGLLVVAVSVRSTAARPLDVVLTATMYDATHTMIAIATGGAVFVQPNQVTTITLTGRYGILPTSPAPSATPVPSIASATISIVTHPSVGTAAAAA